MRLVTRRAGLGQKPYVGKNGMGESGRLGRKGLQSQARKLRLAIEVGNVAKGLSSLVFFPCCTISYVSAKTSWIWDQRSVCYHLNDDVGAEPNPTFQRGCWEQVLWACGAERYIHSFICSLVQIFIHLFIYLFHRYYDKLVSINWVVWYSSFFLLMELPRSTNLRHIFFPLKHNSQQEGGVEVGVETTRKQMSWVKLKGARLKFHWHPPQFYTLAPSTSPTSAPRHLPGACCSRDPWLLTEHTTPLCELGIISPPPFIENFQCTEGWANCFKFKITFILTPARQAWAIFTFFIEMRKMGFRELK